MRTAPPRPAWLQLVTVFGGFLLGPAGALGLAAMLTPDSTVVVAVAVPAFALIFAVGGVLWLGLGVASVALDFLLHVALRRSLDSRLGPGPPRIVPPGSFAFFATGVLVGVTMGGVAFLTTALSPLVGLSAWTGLGGAYGALLWAAARHGYLPFDPT